LAEIVFFGNFANKGPLINLDKIVFWVQKYFLQPFYKKESGMSFPKKGKSLPPEFMDDLTFATVISLALKRAAKDRQVTVKMVVNWTGANERTVKNWFSGKFGPSGDHLMVLARYCDEVMVAVMRMAGRKSGLMTFTLDEVERRLLTALSMLHELKAEES
jgi:hypothetical protein